MDTRAGLLLAGGTGGSSGGDLHGSQAAAAAAALQVASQPLADQGAEGQQLLAGTGTDSGEPAYLTLEVHSALARCVLPSRLLPACVAEQASLGSCFRVRMAVQGWKEVSTPCCPLAALLGNPRPPVAKRVAFPGAPPRCRSNRPPVGSGVSPQATVAKSRSRSTTSPQKLEQLAAGLSPSPPSRGRGTQASKVSALGQPPLEQQEEQEGLSGEQCAAGQQPAAMEGSAPAAKAAGAAQPAPEAGLGELAGADLPATQAVMPSALLATARATQLPATAPVRPSWAGELPATAAATGAATLPATVAATLPATATATLPATGAATLPTTAAATAAQPPASQFPLLATQEVGLLDEAQQEEQEAQQAQQEEQQGQGASQLAAAVAAAAVACALAAAPAGSPTAGAEAAVPEAAASPAADAGKQCAAQLEQEAAAALEACAVEPAVPQPAAAAELATEPAVPAPLATAPASFIPLPSALQLPSAPPPSEQLPAVAPEEAAAGDADMPDAAAEPEGAEAMEVEEAVAVAAAPGPQEMAAEAGEAVGPMAPAPAAVSAPAGSHDSGGSSLYSYSSGEEEGSQGGGERVPPSPICTAEQVSLEQQRLLDAFLGRAGESPSGTRGWCQWEKGQGCCCLRASNIGQLHALRRLYLPLLPPPGVDPAPAPAPAPTCRSGGADAGQRGGAVPVPEPARASGRDAGGQLLDIVGKQSIAHESPSRGESQQRACGPATGGEQRIRPHFPQRCSWTLWSCSRASATAMPSRG